MTCQKREPITAESIKRVLSYDAASGQFHWIASGRKAGCEMGNGYITIGVDGSLYLAHRLAWLWANGFWPVGHIDHINRVRSDNRLSNLREATVQQNMANTGARSSSKSGAKGVSWCKSSRKWRATVTVNGRQKSLGRHKEFEDAVGAYQAEMFRLYGEFAVPYAPQEGQ